MPDIGIPELLIILVLVLLLFGPGRIAQTGGELGKAIRSFRDGLSGEAVEHKDDSNSSNPSG